MSTNETTKEVEVSVEVPFLVEKKLCDYYKASCSKRDCANCGK